MNDRKPEAAAAARLSGLTKRFPGFELGPLDLVLEPGTVLALVGPNGAGKTTTLNCMAGLVVPDGGGTEVYGAPVHPARTEYQVITRDAESTLQQLAELGAEAVEVSRMSVDEIAVQILKEGHHVARSES